MSAPVALCPPPRQIEDALAIAACRAEASPLMRGRCFHALAALRAAHGSIAAARAAAAEPYPDGGAAA